MLAMSRSRLGAPELGRLLRVISEPVYIVDAERQIVFVNQALLNLTGLAENDLLGLTCRYHSEPATKPADALAAGLCPPPAAFQRPGAAGSLTGRVTLPTAQNAAQVYAAEFRPLYYEAAELAAVWVVVHPQPLDPEVEAKTPAQADELHERLRRHRAALAQRFDLDRLVGESPAARRIRAQAHVAARSEANVLLVGPVGSGRGELARAIHYHRAPGMTAGLSAAAGTLAPLDGAALTGELLATTIRTLTAGESQRRAAAPAAILLSEVDLLEPAAQVELAGILNRKPPALRWYATSKRPLTELAAAGEFRLDLACALSTLVIDLPGLAERIEDLPLLAQAMAEGLNARGTKQIQSFTPEALDLLAGYGWPGNVTELAEMVRAAHAAAEGSQIRANDLPARIHLAREAALYPPRVDEPVNLADFVARLERELIERALARSRGNKSKAAKLLGMTRPKLLRRLAQFGLTPAEGDEIEFELDESAEEPGGLDRQEGEPG
jgi:DNA-binding NtrC family response regulator